MSVQCCQRETTTTEFFEWQEYFRQDMNMPRRSDYYMAQIAAEIRRGNCAKPRAVTNEHFLLEFALPQEAKPLTDEEKKKRLVNSKAAWSAIAGQPPRKPKHVRNSTGT